MKKKLKRIGAAAIVGSVVYWSVAGAVALWNAGWNWGKSGFDSEVLKDEFKKRFLK